MAEKAKTIVGLVGIIVILAVVAMLTFLGWCTEVSIEDAQSL